MSPPSGDVISVRVDPANPGQFFACCGLLELADRLWGGAEGWFEETTFLIRTIGRLRELVRALSSVRHEQVTSLAPGLVVKPLIAPLRLSFGTGIAPITLDAWIRILPQKGEIIAVANPPWNFWSGQQTPIRIWTALQRALNNQLSQHEEFVGDNLFEQRLALTGRFGFDPRAAWNALDVGFSPNDQDLPVDSSPVTEMFAALGLQRFRPIVTDDKEAFFYYTWGWPLAPSLAAAAAVGAIPTKPSARFRGRVISRGSYGGLGYSTCEQRS